MRLELNERADRVHLSAVQVRARRIKHMVMLLLSLQVRIEATGTVPQPGQRLAIEQQ